MLPFANKVADNVDGSMYVVPPVTLPKVNALVNLVPVSGRIINVNVLLIVVPNTADTSCSSGIIIGPSSPFSIFTFEVNDFACFKCVKYLFSFALNVAPPPLS